MGWVRIKEEVKVSWDQYEWLRFGVDMEWLNVDTNG